MPKNEWEVGDTLIAEDFRTFTIIAIDHEAAIFTVEGNTPSGHRTVIEYHGDRHPAFRHLRAVA